MIRRSVGSAMLVVAVVAIASGCGAFKPIDPNAKDRAKQAPKEKQGPKEVTSTTAAPATSTAPTTSTAPATSTKTPETKAPEPTNRAPAPSTKQTATREPAAPRGSLSDPNIAAMVLALNNTDISYARLALARATDQAPSRAQRDDVKQFASRMLTDHTGVNGLVTQLLTKLDVAPEDNELSLNMRDESADNRDKMRELNGYAFDSTYIENEVKYHQKFLSQIDNLMLRDARNAELKGLLTAVRPAVAAHLAHAEQVRADVLAKK
jgi:putative membrane protein